MGWSSGSALAEHLLADLAPYIAPKNLRAVVGKVLTHFHQMDCDTLDELRGHPHPGIDREISRWLNELAKEEEE